MHMSLFVLYLVMSAADCKLWIDKLSTFLSEYRWLLDSYIIEFFTELHWSKLPHSWAKALTASDNKSLIEIAQLILGIPSPNHRVYPLSLLSFVATCRLLSTPLHVPPQCEGVVEHNVRPQVDGINHLFRRHVKPKKQHEIKFLGKVVFDLCQQMDCKNVVDIGSGQGHLARYLAFHYGLNVTAVEALEEHVEAANKYDREVKRDLSKLKRKQQAIESPPPPEFSFENEGRLRHIKVMVYPDTTLEELMSQVTVNSCTLYPGLSTSHRSSEGFILTGLHTCGDLAPTMLRIYSQTENALGLVSVGCCYMKLTPKPPQFHHHVMGYPMSCYVEEGLISHPLSYEAGELACHSFHACRERLKENLESLKVHCHRAVTEILLSKNGMKRTQIRISKRISKLPFRMYAENLLKSVASPSTLVVSDEDLDIMETKVENEWRSVVVFFMLRQAIAPCVERLLLIDRQLYLLEQGYWNTHLFPIFSSIISPRCVVLHSNKDNSVT